VEYCADYLRSIGGPKASSLIEFIPWSRRLIIRAHYQVLLAPVVKIPQRIPVDLIG
jgi:hypothetical protein